MGKIDYKAIYDRNKHGWYDMTEDPQKYEALLAGHYSDSNHFVYELLQNAEDAFDVETGASASKVVIEYYSDRLVFYHNGKPFDEADARGVSSMLMGTKDRDDAQTIGRFGMGFKSVFKYTYQPEIYSDDEAFKITNYLLPVEITEGWDYEAEKKTISCKLGGGRAFLPFLNDKHLTKIVIPFEKYGKDGELVSVPGDDVLQKLDELSGEILLFLTHIKKLYWVNKETGKFAYITLNEDETDEKLITCRIAGTDYGDKEEISRYLKFKRVFNHKDMENAEVSVAYKLNNRADNINEMTKTSVWVYFPTKDETDLPFLVHGAFETAVSREKLMSPSSFNDDLFDELGNLIAESMEELAKRKLITQMFLRKSMMVAFQDEEENGTIPGLKDKVTKAIVEKGLLPDRTGQYRKPEEMVLPVPFRMADFADRPPFNKAFASVPPFVAFNNERETKFSEFFLWLTDDLELPLFMLSDLAEKLDVLGSEYIYSSGETYAVIKGFYEFLSDNRESVYDTGLSYSRSGPYEAELRRDLKGAWRKLRNAPIVLNRQNHLVPSEIDDKPAVYLGSSSEYKSVMQSALVDKNLAETYQHLFREGFQIKEFNNFQYVKEKVIQKYIDIEDALGFVNEDDYTKEYIEDLNQIFELIKETNDIKGIKEMLKDAYIIKVKGDDTNGDGIFNCPGNCYIPVSEEGINLETYYAPIPNQGSGWGDLRNMENWHGFDVDLIDEQFYRDNGVSISDLSKLGLVTTPVKDGMRRMEGVGDNYWVALDEFCPYITIDGLDENIEYIENYPDHERAKEKSVEILKLLLSIAGKLKGRKRKRQRNPYEGKVEEVFILRYTIKTSAWLYDQKMEVSSPSKLSKHDLNPALYSNISAVKEAYETLGFIEKEADEAEDTLQKAANLNKQDKRILLNWLARDLGFTVTEGRAEPDEWSEEENTEETFNPSTWVDTEFPVRKVNSMEYLVRHVQEQFYCADPTTYQKVLRQIRVSKNSKADRAYAIGMYTNASGVTICQMCQKPVAFTEVSQIANFGIEMPQLNLCFCRECAAKYGQIRDVNKEKYKSVIRNAILSLDVESNADDYSIEFDSDRSLHFTQTHIAEVQEIFRLLAEYGTPVIDSEEQEETVSGPLLHPHVEHEEKLENKDNEVPNMQEEPELKSSSEGVAKAGRFISYKKKFGDYEIYDNVLNPVDYALHQALEGHRVGDVITFHGKQYEIVGL